MPGVPCEKAVREFDSYRRLQGHSVFATVNIRLSGPFAGKPRSR
jgi:hypothetical protein